MRSSISRVGLAVLVLLTILACGDDTTNNPGDPGISSGIIQITFSPDTITAPWICHGPDGASFSGRGDSVLSDMAPGAYEMIWSAWCNTETPDPETLPLSTGATLSFHHDYICYPDPPPPVQPRWLFSVAGNSADDVYAVGTGGAVFHYNGNQWTVLDSETSFHLVKAWADGQGATWVCGHDGVVMTLANGLLSHEVSGTDADLYCLGMHGDEIHFGGSEGRLFHRVDGVITPLGGQAIIRDEFTMVPLDTLAMEEDIAAIYTINPHFVGGAYYTEEGQELWEGQGMVLAPDHDFDWWLQPAGDDETAMPELVLCSVSDGAFPGHTWFGTTEGWAYRLVGDQSGQLQWEKYPDRLTQGPGSGIRDMWLTESADLYLVTDEGQIVFLPDGGEAETLLVQFDGLSGIWGASPDEFFVVGFMEATLIRCSHDKDSGAFTAEMVDLSTLW